MLLRTALKSSVWPLTLPRTLFMSRPSILHSLICITVVGVFLFPFYLVTSMAACISVNMFLTLNALHLLPLVFPLGCFVCCSSPEPAAMFLSKVCIVTALTLHCLGRPSSHMGQEAYAPGRLRPGFSCIPCFWPRTSPPGPPGLGCGAAGERNWPGSWTASAAWAGFASALP